MDRRHLAGAGGGSGIYVLLGVNRVRRHAVAMRGDMVHHRTIPHVMSVNSASQETSTTPEPDSFAFSHDSSNT